MTEAAPAVPAKPAIAGLYAIADSAYLAPERFGPAVAEAIAGGARAIQYRDKRNPAEVRARIAADLVALCRRHGIPLIVNDDPLLAKQVGAHGVHLGRDDADVVAARRLLGPAALIGVSCYNDLARAQPAERAGADYIAFGSFYPSPTKPHAARADLELLRAAHAALHVPIVAIGGITPKNGPALIAAGADALAAIEGVFGQPDIRAATLRYARLFN
ncbi:MAG: thiamine-phosphate diphosphorylase [Candidatus Muproteobacteria bacterium RBG_16_64_11]|uniref:Thiamine-phosphate synthase n=1 Tax=Candidatus Muproteobacteria bacterium RBG_16_64_11 TaxID=1817758 RepID=A0A1F6TH86_9PROT|nr:MAG: thiamine-phosphate diphosphorylase [Candidatus Muproteobacteria bacterium RBG_16_64_11]